ncbi:PREDICTED: probable RNA-dependent RNA polymerase 5 isoform X2 [Tarenaya hassleriana]|uniref:probable RNA-dependent RNA polymerase 5 isoform X2 n=1 Tax=Tarenaya hassleriana TaxID=28532 RepID=UPI00053C081B|nr:PREDICTED: probable RNA-dependent RNA polymerase 5 isoform X2 [Tarenaya hassleriana]
MEWNLCERDQFGNSYYEIETMSGSRPDITLPDKAEALLGQIYFKHKLPPINPDTRLRLSSIPEELALETLRKVYNSKVKYTLDGYINFLLSNSTGFGSPLPSPGGSPAKTPNSSGKIGCRAFQEIAHDSETRHLKNSRREDDGASLFSSQQLALGELEFKKAFLMLNYIADKRLEEVITADEIRRMKDLPMVEYESGIWNRLGLHFCRREDRRMLLEWDCGKPHYYQCYVASDGTCRFKGPFLENTTTHLHKVLGDENVLMVKFEDVACRRDLPINSSDSYSTYKHIATNGIMIGLRRYQFFVFKDGGKEEKKKDPSTKGVKCYFVCTDSRAFNDRGKDYNFSRKSVHEVRMHFMHVHNLQTLANYMARFSLILSKTKKLEVDLTDINFDRIDDINCHVFLYTVVHQQLSFLFVFYVNHYLFTDPDLPLQPFLLQHQMQDQDGNVVFDKNGKPFIHSDGTGYISEDLARKCPMNIYKGQCTRGKHVQGNVSEFEAQEGCSQEPPLLIQFRLFYNGCAVKGTFLMNKKLPPRTIQVRPSMIKVDTDPHLSNFSSINSLEVVSTSNPPKRTKLSRNLIALLSYGEVPNDFFLDILLNTLEESKTIFYDTRAALKVALNYADMDDYNAVDMITAGIPLEEPFLKHHLSILLKTERKDLKAGKLPVAESYYLMGTVDPTGMLEKDEVCVILETGQISGDVLVYRNPGLHFGDIHILKATYVKSLEDFVGNSKYGVFFPQKGPRSLGDEIAGGDFDGDMYFVSRNPELLKYFKASKPWVSLSSTSKSISGRRPSDLSSQELEDELFNMFLATRFRSFNVIGMAADSWLAIMDRLLILGDDRAGEKVEMKKTMHQLIDIYYDALDAPKKGAKVDLPNELRADMFPHYMERDPEKSFRSTSVLGLIYDFVKSHKTEEISPSEIKKLPCFEAEQVPESLTERLKNWYENYRAEMSRALDLKIASDRNGAADEIIRRYKQEFYGSAGFEDWEKHREELYPRAIAIYNLVYDHAIRTQRVANCGFAWKVAGPVLSRFYSERTPGKTVLCSVAVLRDILGNRRI